ncbi:protein Jade-1-like isoform X2 [Brevipalpus obovatus]|uniref:protein Jade-1-like isoform X2 n=1 Tax=Brevipalpus obovatus TaxID=246614 RepID=UPI003D9EED14
MSIGEKINANASGKRARYKMGLSLSDEKDSPNKRFKNDLSAIMGDVSSLKKNRIYNYGCSKKPAELFRKDLISAMKMADGEQLSREDYLLITDSWKEEWEKGVQVPVNPDSLPEPKFRCIKVKEENDSSPDPNRNRPHKKFKKVETDFDCYGHYELDLLDLCWLQSLQETDESVRLSEEFVESLINELEHHCARNMKAKQVGIEYDDHVLCDVCRSPDAEDGNEMVFCDSCNICVHQACYGITHIPDGEWLCSPCKELGYQKDLSCVLCPITGGALKPTTNQGEWAHVACALWIPEVNIGCPKLMEPITRIKQISQMRWNLLCSICKIKRGAPIQCSVSTCKVAYHVSCAFNAKLKMKAVAIDDKKGVKLKSFCNKHSNYGDDSGTDLVHSPTSPQSETKGSEETATYLEPSNVSDNDDSGYEFWKYIDINQIHQEFLPFLQEKYPNSSKEVLIMYIDLVLQYWKLKRITNCGTPLIRMISSASLERLKMQQHAGILRFRVDLERIRNLSYMLCRREKIKRNWIRTHQSTIEAALTFATGQPLPEIDSNGDASPSSSPKEIKSATTVEERVKLAKDIINSSIIYDKPTEELKNKPKVLLKKLRAISRNDNEKWKRLRPNPYAKFYLQRRSEIQEKAPRSPLNGSHNKCSPNQVAVNGFPVSSSSLPLRSRTVPLNHSPKSSESEAVLKEKSVVKSNNQLQINSRSPDVIKEKATHNFAVLTRAAALIGYRIPKKKHTDQQDSDQIRRLKSNLSMSPFKNSHNDLRANRAQNRHFLRKHPMEGSFKGNSDRFEKRRSFMPRRF